MRINVKGAVVALAAMTAGALSETGAPASKETGSPPSTATDMKEFRINRAEERNVPPDPYLGGRKSRPRAVRAFHGSRTPHRGTSRRANRNLKRRKARARAR